MFKSVSIGNKVQQGNDYFQSQEYSRYLWRQGVGSMKEKELVQGATGIIRHKQCLISLPGDNYMGFYVRHTKVFYMFLLVIHFTIR